MSRRIIYIVLLIVFLAFTFYEEIFLRKHLFQQHCYLLAGSLPNFLATVIMSFGYASVKYPSSNRAILNAIISFTCGLILYEFAQIIMPQRIFDVNDIFASIIGGVFSFFTIYFINTSKYLL